jgi:hypothetical protein
MPMCHAAEIAAIISAVATNSHDGASVGKMDANTLVQNAPDLGLVKLVTTPIRKALLGGGSAAGGM